MGPEPGPLRMAVENGQWTHDDVRYVLTLSLRRPEVLKRVRGRLGDTVRALIVDEVYDANDLHLMLIRLAADAGVDVTVIGDPWQALYGFRGAKPDKVPALIRDVGMVTLPLSRSFRWRSPAQQTLADDLRGGRGVTLVQQAADEAPHMDVVLACLWDDLWTAGDFVLPLAWGSAKGNNVEAASTLLLNQVTRHALGTDATYLTDALSTLGITDKDAVERLEPALMQILAALRVTRSKAVLAQAYVDLIAAMRSETGREFPPKAHANYTGRLARLAARLTAVHPCIPGMTVHQAKGQEWDHVGIRLTDEERHRLASGLARDKESHRTLYVAATRARHSTIDVLAVP
jgi:DNA helicase-2/ATP-dependent DNA helicase PcrA